MPQNLRVAQLAHKAVANPELIQGIVGLLNGADNGAHVQDVDWQAVANDMYRFWRPSQAPQNTKREIYDVNLCLAADTARWLAKHGKPVKPRLTEEQVRDLHLCYNLIDLDHGGSIDIEELDTAFKLLGIECTRFELQAMVREVDFDGSGEIEYPEFVEIMTSSLSKMQAAQRGSAPA